MSISGRDPATGKDCTPGHGVAEALVLMERALTLLDEHEAPADVGAHLDLAIQRLKEWVKTHS